MKFIHLADLHIGKSLNGYSLIEDQKYILDEILGIIKTETPDAVLIAGDVYDKSVPSSEAVGLLDGFLSSLSGLGVETFIISGNHDSAERLSFGSRLMDGSGIHIARAFDGNVPSFERKDRYGDVVIRLLPFLKPAAVRPYFEGEEISGYTDALRAVTGKMRLDTGKRNVLVAHQFVTGAARCDSEEISVGGLDNVDASVFDGFDYVALGHIHGPQNIDGTRIRYCGTPLKYSFSEASHEKSVTVVELGAKGEAPKIHTVPLKPLHDMREIKGTYEELTRLEYYSGTAVDDYMRVTLLDEEDVPEAFAKLKVIYPNLMKLDYDNTRTRNISAARPGEAGEGVTPEELFAGFYESRNGRPMTEEQKAYMDGLMAKIWGEGV